MHIYLVEGLPRLLNGMSEKSSQKALKALKRFSVQVLLGTMVKSYDGETVVFEDGNEIPTRTVIWAAGVRGCVPKGIPENSVGKSRIEVDIYNRVAGFNNLFAVGDIAMMKTDQYPEGHPMLAPVAMQQGKLIAKNLKRLIRDKELKPFRYVDKGTMATIGRNRAVVDLPAKVQFSGFIAWIIWMFVHLLQIIGLRNKLVIFSNWVWNYFTYDRGTRLIIRPFKPSWETPHKKTQRETPSPEDTSSV